MMPSLLRQLAGQADVTKQREVSSARDLPMLHSHTPRPRVCARVVVL